MQLKMVALATTCVMSFCWFAPSAKAATATLSQNGDPTYAHPRVFINHRLQVTITGVMSTWSQYRRHQAIGASNNNFIPQSWFSPNQGGSFYGPGTFSIDIQASASAGSYVKQKVETTGTRGYGGSGNPGQPWTQFTNEVHTST